MVPSLVIPCIYRRFNRAEHQGFTWSFKSAVWYVQADVGIKGSKISAIGKAGNPDVMDGVTKGMFVGVSLQAASWLC